MELEDEATLAECLERAEISKLSEVLRAFQEIREPRCKLVQEWAVMKGKRATIPDGPEQEQRDKVLKLFNAWVKAKPWDSVHVDELPELEAPEFETPDWMKGHNAVYFVSLKCRGSEHWRVNLY
jgi:salicylate hydroxylase